MPAHMNEEIAENVFEEHVGEIYDEAENQLHAQKSGADFVHGGQITFDRHLFDRTFPICPKKKRAERLFFSLEERKPKGARTNQEITGI